MNATTMLRVARDEWPALTWRIVDPRPALLTCRAALSDGVGILIRREAHGWVAALMWLHPDCRWRWHPGGAHPTLRAALRECRYLLGYSLAGASRDALLDPEHPYAFTTARALADAGVRFAP